MRMTTTTSFLFLSRHFVRPFVLRRPQTTTRCLISTRVVVHLDRSKFLSSNDEYDSNNARRMPSNMGQYYDNDDVDPLYQTDEEELMRLYSIEQQQQQQQQQQQPTRPVSSISTRPLSTTQQVVELELELNNNDSNASSSDNDDNIFELVGDAPPPPSRTPSPRPVAKSPEPSSLAARASTGLGATTDLELFLTQRSVLEKRVQEQHSTTTINLQSPKQVAKLLGIPGESTRKDVLETMAAADNELAGIVLEHRRLTQSIKRLQRKETAEKSGAAVRNFATVQKTTTDESPTLHDTTAESDPLILVDASAYIFRAYYSMPPIHRGDGMPTGALMGFCNMLNRLVLSRALLGERPRICLVFDAPGPNFRHVLYPEYKANRDAAPIDLVPQFPFVRQAAEEAYGLPCIEAPGYEADDVIATLATQANQQGVDVHILSGDKDLMQLITPTDTTTDGAATTHMIDPVRMERVTAVQVHEKWGVGPELLGDILALAGDAADNVPGVPGIGPKTAAALLNEFGSLEGLLENVDQIKQKGRRTKLEENIAQARLSRKLVQLTMDVPQEVMTFPEDATRVSELKMNKLDGQKLLQFYEKMGFRDLQQRVKARMDGASRQRSKRKYKTRAKVEVPTPDEFRSVPF